MKKEDGIVKKAADVLNEKVVPAARESLGKGASAVGELLENTGKRAGELAEAAGEKTREAGKALEKKGEQLIANKNDAFRHFRQELDEVGKKAAKVKDDVVSEVKERRDQTLAFTKNKAEDVSKTVELQKEQVVPSGNRRKTVVKTAAGVAVLAAAAAGAYAYYKKRRAEEEAIKAEFSEKMKKWNELEGEELKEAGKEAAKMQLRPTSIYTLGKNALLGDDIIVNIAYPGEGQAEFNPDEVSEPINTVEELRKKAAVIAGRTGEKARQVAEIASEKAKDLYHTAQDKAEELKERRSEKEFEIYTEPSDSEAEESLPFNEAPADDIQENRLEADPSDETPTDNLAAKDAEDSLDDSVITFGDSDPSGEEIPWQEDESVLMQRTAELRRKGAEGFQTVKEKLTEAKEYVVDKYHQMKPEEEPEVEEDFFDEEYQVTIHNRGNKDYFFSPMLIQRYNSRKRMAAPVPAHEQGTTLEQRIIKPGETYSGRIVIKMTASDDALIMFEDLLMKNSVAIILEEELDEQFLYDESQDQSEDLLFEGIEDDLEDYEFAEDELKELDLDDLARDEAEELDFELSQDDAEKPVV